MGSLGQFWRPQCRLCQYQGPAQSTFGEEMEIQGATQDLGFIYFSFIYLIFILGSYFVFKKSNPVHYVELGAFIL